MSVPVPAIRVEIRVEGLPRIHVVAPTLEDEARLRAWLRSSDVLERVGVAIENLADDLDELEQAGWTIEELLPRLRGVVPRGGKDWIAVCPRCRAHDRTLAVHAHGGTALFHCFRGCQVGDILSAIDALDASADAA